MEKEFIETKKEKTKKFFKKCPRKLKLYNLQYSSIFVDDISTVTI